MRKINWCVPAVIGIALLAAHRGEARQPEGPADVTVCLRTTMIGGPGSIERAKSLAKTMFASIGIHLEWRMEMSGREHGVRIHVLMSNGDSENDDDGALASAYPFASEHDISVRYDRVCSSAGASREMEALLLAHVLVHEITHVLQCVNRHSDTGVMKARWTTEDYFDMRWKPLEFTAEDIELIRLGMRELQSRGEVLAEPGASTHDR